MLLKLRIKIKVNFLYLEQSIKLPLATLNDLRFCKLHVPKQVIRSLIAIFKPLTSKSITLCSRNIFKPFTERFEAFFNLTCLNLVVLASNRVIVKSDKTFRSQRLYNNCSEISSGKNVSGSLKQSLVDGPEVILLFEVFAGKNPAEGSVKITYKEKIIIK